MRNMDPKQKTVVKLVGVVVFMGAMAWAAVPAYNLFCKVTGFGGTPAVAEAASSEVVDQEITIRFDASKDRGMPWEFRPMERSMKLKLGETGLAFYEAYNPTDRPVAGQASYNVVPYAAGGYFTKIECFCFTEQVLQPGERVEMPVTFYVDPDILNDLDGKFVHTITLSYTFHEIDLPENQAALDLEDNGSGTQTSLN
ncbi:cytochrome c oxidase assembly protein [Chachezhania sediminis]|uniref:cytochrome c oxidase assembly protein n=1 Tax=Chachezhania sediminis TaxID=2599291 RepID=UPI001E51A077|nr:cytochrome c oxidase assembly protein [Chachezhania sediminis]